MKDLTSHLVFGRNGPLCGLHYLSGTICRYSDEAIPIADQVVAGTNHHISNLDIDAGRLGQPPSDDVARREASTEYGMSWDCVIAS